MDLLAFYFFFLLEVELYLDEVLHADLVGSVDDVLVVVERVAFRVAHARVDSLTHGHESTVRPATEKACYKPCTLNGQYSLTNYQ